MIKKLLFFSALLILTGAGAASARNNNQAPVIPSGAKEVAPGVFDLGTARDDRGRTVQGYAIVEPKEGHDHRPNHSRGGGGGTNTSCFAYIAKGAKWKAYENYLVDARNVEGLDETFVRSTIASSLDKWEAASGGNNLFGDEASGSVDRGAIGTLNNKNEVMFGDVNSAGAIAVTYVWGIFSGPMNNRELVEWDQIYDQNDFDWTSDGNIESNKMDFENIVTHEHGHAFGMGHPSDSCTEESMFRFSTEGETKRRDLHTGDEAGIHGLYN